MENKTYQNIDELVNQEEYNYSIKDIIEDITTGMSVKNIKNKYSSQFSLVNDFSRNWSWENRAKNVDLILKKYLTIDDYISVENGGENNNDPFDELQTVYSTIQNKVSKNKRIKNQGLVLEQLTKTSDYIRDTSKNNIEVKTYESEVVLPVKNFQKQEYSFKRKEYEGEVLDLEEQVKQYECEVIPFPNRSVPIEKDTSLFSPRVQEIINSKKKQAEFKTKIWFSEMTKEKNPEKYLETKIEENLAFTGMVEREIASEYILRLKQLSGDQNWRTIFDGKKSWFSRKKRIDLIENVIGNYESKLGIKIQIHEDNKTLFEGDNCREFKLEDNNKPQKNKAGNTLKRIAGAALLGTMIGTSTGAVLGQNELEHLDQQITAEQEFQEYHMREFDNLINNRSSQQSNGNGTEQGNTLGSDVLLPTNQQQITHASITSLDTDEISEILHDNDLSLETYHKARTITENNSEETTSIINEGENYFVINPNQNRAERILELKKERLSRIEGFDSLTTRTQQNIMSSYSLANNNFGSVLYATNGLNGGDIEIATIKDGKIEREVLRNRRTI